MQMWQPSVLETYGDKTTSYVEKIQGPLRDKYPDAMEKEELITSLTEVNRSLMNLKIDIRYIRRTRCTTTPMTRTLPS